ncbi:unnamed protein product [Leptidea sinapis]|uniref:Uncharacterized protein n=1 Tax=Leptidea sinapis TaxID=189913 RepID=A0A5E4PZW4_9NEOP|nr:unnamed protein product [Leptidea sinapis]
MSDKSFGDHTSRGIVKNPLLSTAVTGLSIEDLTHNAVLLPAKTNSELITRRDNAHKFKMCNFLKTERYGHKWVSQGCIWRSTVTLLVWPQIIARLVERSATRILRIKVGPHSNGAVRHCWGTARLFAIAGDEATAEK